MTSLLRWVPLAMVLSMWAAPAHAELVDLPEASQKALQAVAHDPPPKELAANAHFVISDERAHWTFADSVNDLGGVLVGVGTDPNYLFAGWMKAELVLLVDFDQVVTDIHGLYGVALRHSSDAEAFVSLWSAKNKKQFTQYLEAEAPDAATAKRWLAAYRLSAARIHEKWLYLRRSLKQRNTPSLLSDPAQFNHVKRLAETHRIWAWRGDLTADKTMAGVQAALRAMNLQVSVFYLTNAEKYFKYTKQARANLRDLPYAERAVILRTQGRPSMPDQIADHHYSYFIQAAADFVAWLGRDNIGSVHPICHRRQTTKVKGVFSLGPPPPPKTPAKAKP
jgi:hypothetical protein